MPQPDVRSSSAQKTGFDTSSDSSASAPLRLNERIEAERLAVGREIHDELGGALTALRFDLSWIGRHTDDPGVLSHVDGAMRSLDHALQAVQRITHGLRTGTHPLGVVAAIEDLARDCQRSTGIAVRIRAELDDAKLPEHVEQVVLRAFQEALNNAAKHAGCTRIDAALTDRAGVLTLEVSDDGCGLAPGARSRPGAFGLLGMDERARSVGGWLDVAPGARGGTLVSLSIPLRSTPSSTLQELSK